MLRKVKVRSEMENSIRKAIEKNEFQIFYQPYYDVKKEKIIGMEALLRWKYKKKELIDVEGHKFFCIALEETVK